MLLRKAINQSKGAARKEGQKKRGNKPGVPLGPQQRTKFAHLSALEIMERRNFNPVDQLIMFALGDVVGLGMMTQQELDAPGRMIQQGHKMRWDPSGQEKALFLITSDLRENAAKELIKYGWSRKPTLNEVTSPDGSVSGQQVVFYLPENGRDKP